MIVGNSLLFLDMANLLAKLEPLLTPAKEEKRILFRNSFGWFELSEEKNLRLSRKNLPLSPGPKENHKF
jgi:hypothetical protein